MNNLRSSDESEVKVEGLRVNIGEVHWKSIELLLWKQTISCDGGLCESGGAIEVSRFVAKSTHLMSGQ